MTRCTQSVRLESAHASDWNQFARTSRDAWFWHTTYWLEFVAEVGRASHLCDLSFMIVHDNAVAAICPLVLEDRGGYRRFSYFGEWVPSPAFSDFLDEATRGRLLKFYVDELERLAAEHGVGYTRVAVPALAPVRFLSGLPAINPLARFGFFDLPVMTQVVDLDLPEEQLWQGVRKGHRSDIKRAVRDVAVCFHDAQSVSASKFREYQDLHAKDAGRVTRSQRSFDIMEEWIRAGSAVLVEATLGGQPVAFALQMLFGAGAYYGSGCKDPDRAALPASHLLQWETMLWLKRHGIRYYEVGPQHFGPQWFYVPTEKEIGIAAFKRGFGGRTAPVLTAERFYSSAVFEDQFRRRHSQYVDSLSLASRLT